MDALFYDIQNEDSSIGITRIWYVDVMDSGFINWIECNRYNMKGRQKNVRMINFYLDGYF